MKTILMTALVVNCSGGEATMVTEYDAGMDIDPVVIIDDYPDGPYGYRAWVRNVDGKLTLDKGDIFPDICLQDDDEEDICVGDWYQSPALDYLIVIASYIGCSPCDELSQHSDRLTGLVVNRLGGMAKVVKLHNGDGGLPEDFTISRWPEINRAYPTTFVVDTETMEIATESVGFSDVNAFWDSLESKLLFWCSERKECIMSPAEANLKPRHKN